MAIYYKIDSIVKEDGQVKINGWVYSDSSKEIKLNVSGAKVTSLTRSTRKDITKQFSNCKSVDQGWSLIIEDKGSIKIEFSDGLTTKKETIYPILSALTIKISNSLSKLKKLFFIAGSKSKRVIREEGFKSFVRKTIKVIRYGKYLGTPDVKYAAWIANNLVSDKVLEKQKSVVFEYMPKISVVVPTYNTPRVFLIEMIDSVISQSYSNWELCIADGASKNADTLELLAEYAEKDERIKVKYLNENLMISGNTNEALSISTGDYISLFDHDDLLTPDALFEVVKTINENGKPDFIYTDEDKTDEEGKHYFDPHFKPDWSPDFLRACNYITHFSVFSRELLGKVGGFRSEFDGSQDFDIILRMTEKANSIYHIPKILYHWRVHRASVASGAGAKPYAYIAGMNAVQAHLERVGLKGKVVEGPSLGLYKINYEIEGNPKISIIIPNKDNVETLKKCIDSLLLKTTYKNYEIIVVENNSTTDSIFNYYKQIEQNGIRVVKFDGEGFNFSSINNYGVSFAEGTHVLLLNNDTEVISPTWIEELLMYSQREDVGVVGAKLWYPDDSLQHAGVVLGLVGVANHLFTPNKKFEADRILRAIVPNNFSAVTGACMMVKKELYDNVNGLDEELAVSLNDIDFCLKIKMLNKLIVMNPYAELYHFESKTRGSDKVKKNAKRRSAEIQRFEEKWTTQLNQGDPFGNQSYFDFLVNY